MISYTNIDIKDDEIELSELSNTSLENIKNKGTGAGGANTNLNGLPYEKLTELKTEYNILHSCKYYNLIQFKNNEDVQLKCTKQNNLFKTMKEQVNLEVEKAHGCKNPDESFINEEKKIIFIIEKKFQQVTGSVCEKIQTPDFKLWQYRRTFPNYQIVYIYCLSDWFRTNCKAELEYLSYKNIPVFWGSEETYKNKIVDFLVNYK